MPDLSQTTPELLGRLDARDIAGVLELVEQVTEVDGTPPLSEHVLLHLPRGGDAEVRNLVLRDDGEVIAYAHLDITDRVEGSSAELAVLPRARGRGLGRALVERMLEQSPDGRLRLWAHGDSPAAAAMARRLGFGRSRVLLQMRRPLSADPASPWALPPVTVPPGVTVRTFRVGQDEQAWTELNNAAFADHPDQGGWSTEEIEIREQEPWFDPVGLFLAERDGHLVGSHWTKVHGSTPEHEHADGSHDHPEIGEVYVVAVHPSEQGHGLGPALTLLGLHSLRDRGLESVLLYVDESNRAAVTVYERLGFRRHAVDVMYSRG